MSEKKAKACKKCGEAEDECLVGPYNEINKECNKAGGEAHHIVPDMTLRTGRRKEALKNKNRIKPKKGKPTSLKKGIAICITDDAHKGLHKELNDELKKLGANNNPPGQAPMNEITKASLDSIKNIESIDSACKKEAEIKVKKDMRKYGNAPGRTTTSLPKETTRKYLENGG